MRVYLVRNGQTEYNRLGIMQGRTDVSLNLFGVKQSHLCAKKLKEIDFDAIYSSENESALQTAKILASMQNNQELDFYSHPLLKAIDLGSFEGLTWAQAIKLNPDINFDNISNKKMAQIYKGESYADVQDRVKYFLDWLSGFNYRNVLIVTHGTIIKSIISNILELKMEKSGKYFVHNTGISIIEKNDSKDWKIVTINDYSHLNILRKD